MSAEPSYGRRSNNVVMEGLGKSTKELHPSGAANVARVSGTTMERPLPVEL
jgi:hypothetical protein